MEHKVRKAWNKGKKMSLEAIEKNRQEKLAHPIRYWLGKHLSVETKKKLSISHIGKNKGKKHWNWQGGKTPRFHHSTSSPQYKKWRSDVFTRDNWTCQTCGIKGCETGGYLVAHHIKSWAKYPELRFDVNNGITLCLECHKLTDNYKNKKST